MATTPLKRGPVLSWWQNLDLAFALMQAVGVAIFATVCAPFRAQNTPASFKRHVLMSTMRRTFARLSMEQTQYLFGGSTEANYLTWTVHQGIAPRIVSLADGATKAFWVGDSTAETIVLYLHGGGFVMPGSAFQLGFASSVISAADLRNKRIGFLFLQYELMPQARYPHQLRQAVDLLRYSLDKLHKRPSQVMLAGDSAGCNLILGMLGHLSHPHPEIEQLALPESLKGVVMSSPWTNLYCTGDAYASNYLQDPVLPSTIAMWAGTYLAGAPEDKYNCPSKAPSSWWAGLQAQDVLIVGGKKEMMSEDITRLDTNLKSVHPSVTTFLAPDGFHAQPTISRDVGLEEGEQAVVMRD